MRDTIISGAGRDDPPVAAVGGPGVVGALPAANTNGTWPWSPIAPVFL